MHFKNSYFVDTEINSLFSPLSQSTAIGGAEWLLTCNYRALPEAPSPPGVNSHITIAIQGFHSVKASSMWEARVVTTAHRTQMMFFPVLSTMSPNIGDMGADMTYTMLPREYKRYYLMKCIPATRKK